MLLPVPLQVPVPVPALPRLVNEKNIRQPAEHNALVSCNKNGRFLARAYWRTVFATTRRVPRARRNIINPPPPS